MDLYVHAVQQKIQEEQRSSAESRSSGYHALFAFEILCRPFTEFYKRAWNSMMAGHLVEAWDRQIHFIESLHLPSPDHNRNPVFELRLIAYPDQNQIDLFFLGKIFAPTLEQARAEALVLGQEVFSLFPFDFVLRPLSDQTNFERAYRSEWIGGLKQLNQIAEIRRFERLLTNSSNGAGITLFYLTHGWQWHLQSMDQVWSALTKYGQSLMFSISLSPIQWDSIDYAYLNQLEAAASEEGLPPGLGPEITSAINLYRQLLYQTPHPFTMRTILVGEPAVPRGLSNAVGAGLCLPPLETTSGQTRLRPSYTSTWPTRSADFSLAKLNLLQLSQYDWGTTLTESPIKHLRYAVDAKQAQWAFRIPIPPEIGFPDISLGREVT
jgi:hypothetical protein